MTTPMESQVIGKRNFQQILATFRNVPECEVVKLSAGYEVRATKAGTTKAGKDIAPGDVMVKAMIGHHGYLVRSMPGLITTL
jgi:hypothetical protein